MWTNTASVRLSLCVSRFFREIKLVARCRCLTVLNRTEISCIVIYLATWPLLLTFLFFFVLYYVNDVVIKQAVRRNMPPPLSSPVGAAEQT